MKALDDFAVRLSTLPHTPSHVAELAVVAEQAGLAGLGVADSAHLHGAMYPSIQHALALSSRIPMGPLVTNPVTRHPSVHAADLAALSKLYPGRVQVAMGTGDSAVHGVGLRPAPVRDVLSALKWIRDAAGDDIRIEMAASGMRAAEATPDWVDAVILGGGLCLPWLLQLREKISIPALIFLVGSLVEAESQVEAARQAVRASVVAVARHALANDPVGRGVPAELRGGMADLFSRYDFAAHAVVGGRNAGLLDLFPDEARYLVDRFSVVGTPEMVANRLRPYAEALDLSGVVLTSTVRDPLQHARLAGELSYLLTGRRGPTRSSQSRSGRSTA